MFCPLPRGGRSTNFSLENSRKTEEWWKKKGSDHLQTKVWVIQDRWRKLLAPLLATEFTWHLTFRYLKTSLVEAVCWNLMGYFTFQADVWNSTNSAPHPHDFLHSLLLARITCWHVHTLSPIFILRHTQLYRRAMPPLGLPGCKEGKNHLNRPWILNEAEQGS